MFLNSIINRFSNQKEGYIDFIKLRKTIEMMYLHLVHFKPIQSKEEGTAAPTTGGRRQDSTTQREGRETTPPTKREGESSTTQKEGGRESTTIQEEGEEEKAAPPFSLLYIPLFYFSLM